MRIDAVLRILLRFKFLRIFLCKMRLDVLESFSIAIFTYIESMRNLEKNSSRRKNANALRARVNIAIFFALLQIFADNLNRKIIVYYKITVSQID